MRKNKWEELDKLLYPLVRSELIGDEKAINRIKQYISQNYTHTATLRKMFNRFIADFMDKNTGRKIFIPESYNEIDKLLSTKKKKYEH